MNMLGLARDVGVRDIITEAVSIAASAVMNRLGAGIATIGRVIRALLSSSQVMDALAGAFGQGADPPVVASFVRHLVLIGDTSLEPVFAAGGTHPQHAEATRTLTRVLRGAILSEKMLSSPMESFLDSIFAHLLAYQKPYGARLSHTPTSRISSPSGQLPEVHNDGTTKDTPQAVQVRFHTQQRNRTIDVL